MLSVEPGATAGDDTARPGAGVAAGDSEAADAPDDRAQGYAEGHAQGYEEGLRDGHAEGYGQGLAEGRTHGRDGALDCIRRQPRSAAEAAEACAAEPTAD